MEEYLVSFKIFRRARESGWQACPVWCPSYPIRLRQWRCYCSGHWAQVSLPTLLMLDTRVARTGHSHLWQLDICLSGSFLEGILHSTSFMVLASKLTSCTWLPELKPHAHALAAREAGKATPGVRSCNLEKGARWAQSLINTPHTQQSLNMLPCKV